MTNLKGSISSTLQQQKIYEYINLIGIVKRDIINTQDLQIDFHDFQKALIAYDREKQKYGENNFSKDNLQCFIDAAHAKYTIEHNEPDLAWVLFPSVLGAIFGALISFSIAKNDYYSISNSKIFKMVIISGVVSGGAFGYWVGSNNMELVLEERNFKEKVFACYDHLDHIGQTGYVDNIAD